MRTTTTDGAVRTRGMRLIVHPRVWGSVIGAIGGTVFVLANRDALPQPWPLVALVGWALAALGYLVAVFLLPRWFAAPAAVRRSAGLVYLGSVAGMLALIQVGRVLLGPDRSALLPAVIVLCVGLHFLPFAAAFHARVFTWLGLAMALVGTVGLVLALVWHPLAAPASAVLTGVLMLALIAADAALSRPPGESVR